jgi:anti-sigma-K factor RskA
MERDEIHELTAAYALHALDRHDEAEYEAHLGHCARCREELAGLQATAASLAYAVPAGRPPDALRERILDRARPERPTVVPQRKRFRVSWPTAAAAGFGLAAAAAVVVLSLWVARLNDRLDSERSARSADVRALALLSDPATRRIALSGRPGALGVTPSGRAVLVVDRLAPPAAGKVYEAWVLRGSSASPAGTFAPRGGRAVLALARSVPAGARVAVTVERAPGAKQPTSSPLITSRPV